MAEKDKALIEAAITKRWTDGERQRHSVNQELLSDLLTVCATVRAEEREAAFKEAIEVAKAELIPNAGVGSTDADFNAATQDVIDKLEAALTEK